MTKKTIMESLKEADEKDDIKGRYYMDQLFSHAADNENDLKFESIEQCVAVRTLDALERIANALEKGQEEDSGGQTLTYHDFCQSFNEISNKYYAEYYAKPFNGIVASISNSSGFVVAGLYASSRIWNFHESNFNCNELALMTQLAATLPELRGGIEND